MGTDAFKLRSIWALAKKIWCRLNRSLMFWECYMQIGHLLPNFEDGSWNIEKNAKKKNKNRIVAKFEFKPRKV